MKRLLLLGALAAAVLVPAAAASPAAQHTLRGTVVAKDRAHHALVVALPGGAVKTVIAPQAFGRTHVGRTVVIRYTGLAGRLPMALGVSLKGHARHAVVQGTIVRLVKRDAVINAGGTALHVHLTATKAKRALASVETDPKVGDTVKVEVEIDPDGSLAASAVVATAAPAGPQVGSGGEMEVRGKVTALSPLTVETGTPPVSISCVVPAGITPKVNLGDMIELKCDLIGTPPTWTVRVAHGEDEHSGQSGDDSSEVKVRGTLTFSTDGLSVIVTPPLPSSPVTCTIPSSVLAQVKAQFTAGDVVKAECVKVGDILTLKEIEKKSGDSGEKKSGDSGGQSGGEGDNSGSSGGSADESGSGGSDD